MTTRDYTAWDALTGRELNSRGNLGGSVEGVIAATYADDPASDLFDIEREKMREELSSGDEDEDAPCCLHPVHWGRFGCAACYGDGGPCQPEDDPTVAHESPEEGGY